LVAPGRIELPRPCGHWILSPAYPPVIDKSIEMTWKSQNENPLAFGLNQAVVRIPRQYGIRLRTVFKLREFGGNDPTLGRG